MKTKYRKVTEKDLENLPLECWPSDLYEKRVVKYKIPNGQYCVERYYNSKYFDCIQTSSCSYICSNYKIKEEIKTIELFECWNYFGVKRLYNAEGAYPRFNEKSMSDLRVPENLKRKTGLKIIIDAESFEILEVQDEF
jgi:hypothetical protein